MSKAFTKSQKANIPIEKTGVTKKVAVPINLIKRKRNHMTGCAGEYYVAAEINRRYAHAVTFAGNMPDIDIIASNLNRSRIVKIQVKSMRSESSKVWQTSINDGKPCKKEPKGESFFWIFCEIKENPEYWIVPDWWIRNNIYEVHKAYLKKHGGKRPGGGKSTHHSIDKKRISEWKDRWDILKIF